METKEIKINMIKQAENSRVDYVDDLGELMKSIKDRGLLQSIVVKPVGKTRYTILAGNRRFMACKKLGNRTISCHIKVPKDKEENDLINIIENIQRVDLSPFEEGRWYKKLSTIHSLSPKEIAARCSITPARVTNCLNIYSKVPKTIAKDVVHGSHSDSTRKTGKITTTLAVKIAKMAGDNRLGVGNYNKALKLAKKGVITQFNVKKALDLLKDGYSNQEIVNGIEHIKHVAFRISLNEKVIKRKKKTIVSVRKELLKKLVTFAQKYQ